MRTEFKREMNRNYMVLHPETEMNETYSLRMLSENRITGLLPFREKRVDGESYLYFNITSKQALSRMMEYRSFTAKEIRQIIEDLLMAMASLEKFLMDGDQLALDPDLIYVDPDDLKANFCFIPGTEGSFEINFRKLSRYILDHVDHTDGDAVILAFALFKAGEKENFGIADLESCLRAGGKNDREAGKMETYERKIQGGCIDDKRELRADQEEKQPVPGEFYVGKQERREGKKSGKYMEQVRKSEQEKQEDADDTEEPDIKWRILQVLLGILLPAVPAAVFLAGGMELVIRLKWGILSAWGILLAGIFAVEKETGGKKGEDEEENGEDWEIMFREEEELERGGIPEAGYSGAAKHFFQEERDQNDRGSQTEEKTGREKDADEMHTVLLTGRQIYPVTRRLVPENGGEDVQVGYFPFLIGKNREISDLCLNLPQISRIHAKIEESGDGYIITDLNSTNGTSVNGHFLETNESMTISPGDQLSFADQRYRFL